MAEPKMKRARVENEEAGGGLLAEDPDMYANLVPGNADPSLSPALVAIKQQLDKVGSEDAGSKYIRSLECARCMAAMQCACRDLGVRTWGHGHAHMLRSMSTALQFTWAAQYRICSGGSVPQAQDNVIA